MNWPEAETIENALGFLIFVGGAIWWHVQGRKQSGSVFEASPMQEPEERRMVDLAIRDGSPVTLHATLTPGQARMLAEWLREAAAPANGEN